MLPAQCRQLTSASWLSSRAIFQGVCLLALNILLAGCAGPQTVDFSPGHIIEESPLPERVPPIVREAPVVPKPVDVPPVETYSVVVKEVPVIDLLFSLARDAGLDLDIQATADKTVTINAVERPLPEILHRIADQAQLRYQLRGNNLIVEDDVPYWYNYLVDYVNISRSSEGEVGVATQIATAGGSVGEDSGGEGDGQGNLSKATIKSTSSNEFWPLLKESLLTLVSEGTSASTDASSAAVNPVIVNEMSGVVTVHGTQIQQRRIQTYLDQIALSTQRQVLIEMTIVEVELSDNYQAGVDWQKLTDMAGVGGDGLSVESRLLGPGLTTPPFVAIGYTDTSSNGDSISASVRMLQQFGETKVLSSPKIMALNNQTALLKVVNEEVYFTIELDIREATVNVPERRTYTSEVHTVPVGLVLSVTPQISKNGYISMNVRPTISRITGYAVDPAPLLSGAEFENLIPQIQVREIESLLQVMDGRTVILGGLMQNERKSDKDGIPGLSRIPKVGGLFSYTRDRMVKSELVIFLKPTIVTNGSNPSEALKLSDYYDSSIKNDAISKIEYR